jgi:hypothetical protein
MHRTPRPVTDTSVIHPVACAGSCGRVYTRQISPSLAQMPLHCPTCMSFGHLYRLMDETELQWALANIDQVPSQRRRYRVALINLESLRAKQSA